MPRLVLRADEHYDVVRFPQGWARYGQIRFLTCRFCNFHVDVVRLHRQGDKSGSGRYYRARGQMVKHIHAEHLPIINGELAAAIDTRFEQGR